MTQQSGAALALLVFLFTATPASADFDFQSERQKILQREQALANNTAGLNEGERLNALIDLYFDLTMLDYPEYATFIGHPAGHDRWTDTSIGAIGQRNDDTVRALGIIRGFDRDALGGVDRLNYDLMLDIVDQQVAGIQFPDHLMPVNQLGGVQQDPVQIFNMMPGQTVGQFENIVARLEGLPALVDHAIAHMRTGLQQGITPPRVTLRDIPEQIESLLTDNPMDSALMSRFVTRPDTIDEKDWSRLTRRAERAYKKSVAPAYRKLLDYFVNDYLTGARESIAATSLPNGEAWYAYRVRQMTTTDMTPREIHDLGQAEVKRIRAEMDGIIESTGFEGDFADFTNFLRTDPQFYFDTAAELITAYRDIAKRADAATVKVIGTLPRLPYGVEAVPDFIAKSQTTAYYQPGSLEAGRAGTFFANTYDLKTRPKWEMEALSLHEAVPGHHLQLALQQELDMPWFRRFGGQTAFVEGWGLYSESLGKEMGFYEDPYSRFGQLTYEIWRAIRLVVDTGMHSLGWSREEAIDYFKTNAGKAEHDIVVEVDRYIVWPGQALAYKIGELRIKALRARAEAALGDSFDLRRFHDAVLENGALPLNVLDKMIDDWIAARQQHAASG